MNIIFSILILGGGVMVLLMISSMIGLELGFEIDAFFDEYMGICLISSLILWTIILSIILSLLRYNKFKKIKLSSYNKENTFPDSSNSWISKKFAFSIIVLVVSPFITLIFNWLFGLIESDTLKEVLSLNSLVVYALPFIATHFAVFKNDDLKFDYIDKEMFFELTKGFFENGLIKEVYVSDEICILNLANAFYVVSNYRINLIEGPVVITIEENRIKTLIENNNLFNQYCDGLGENLKSCIGVLNKKTYINLQELKRKTDNEGAMISLQYENILIERAKKAVEKEK